MPWQCSRCSSLNGPESAFCATCGQASGGGQTAWFCGSCGARQDGSSRFCRKCGRQNASQGGAAFATSILQPYKEIGGSFPPDFTMKAVITAVLYWVFWIPGVVANVVWMSEARACHTRTGIKPAGYGCLWWLFVLFIVIPLAITALLILILFVAGISLAGIFAKAGLS